MSRRDNRPRCPADPSHGPLLDAPGADHGFYCPHEAHYGRPESHQDGPSAPSNPYFRTDEAEWAPGELMEVYGK